MVSFPLIKFFHVNFSFCGRNKERLQAKKTIVVYSLLSLQLSKLLKGFKIGNKYILCHVISSLGERKHQSSSCCQGLFQVRYDWNSLTFPYVPENIQKRLIWLIQRTGIDKKKGLSLHWRSSPFLFNNFCCCLIHVRLRIPNPTEKKKKVIQLSGKVHYPPSKFFSMQLWMIVIVIMKEAHDLWKRGTSHEGQRTIPVPNVYFLYRNWISSGAKLLKLVFNISLK